MTRPVNATQIPTGPGAPLLVIAGPCVIENEDIPHQVAAALKALSDTLGFTLVFKASYDKANRTAITSFRGPGITDGLRILASIRDTYGIPILSDVHSVADVAQAAAVLDVIQIPAFLCRQTDLLVAAAHTGKTVNVKKGQFLAPWDMKNVVDKLTNAGCRSIWITERGASFGYNNLVVDFRGIPAMQATGHPVIFDATHSVQLPGGGGDRSGGDRAYAPLLAKAAVAAGVDGVFMEVHPDPDNALCDGPNSLPLEWLEDLLTTLLRVRQAVDPPAQAPVTS
ncbi:MAG: 3-deoxy-8-phosphooctulonate synthase [Pseudomonadota bacterium]